jgi:hypothetical protein
MPNKPINRKYTATGILSMLLTSMATLTGFSQALDDTKTQMALPLPAAPVIDGVLNAGEWAYAGGASQNYWRVIFDANLEDFYRGGGPGDGNPLEPVDATDLQYNIYAGVHGNNLYIAVEVADDWINNDGAEPGSENGQTWTDDSVEIFIDGDNSNLEVRSTDGNPAVIDTGGQFVITANNAYRQAEAGDPGYGPDAAWYARTALTDTGYVAEFRISLDIIGKPKPGSAIGFTVGVNDDDAIGDAGSERQILWTGTPHTEATYGNLIIGERTYTAPKTTAPAVDGKVSAAEYAGAETIVLNRHTGMYHIGVGDDEWPTSDHSLQAWVVHDTAAIYVGVVAVDDAVFTDSAEAGSEDGQTWVDDSIEVFFDANDSNDLTRDPASLYEGQFVITPNGARRDAEANNPTWGPNAHWFGAATKTDTGYQIEFKVTKEALLGITDGARVGFNIAMNDDDGSGRKSQLNWAGNPHQEFSYGALILGAAAGGVGGGQPANIRIAIASKSVTLQWDGNGTLETASDVTGPWTAVAGAASGVRIPASNAQAFYRVR